MFVEGYTDQLSYRAGEKVRFHVSTSAEEYELEVARIGTGREVVWRQDQLPGAAHPVLKTPRPMAAAGRFPTPWRCRPPGAAGSTSSRCAPGTRAAGSCGGGGAPPRAGAFSSSVPLAPRTPASSCSWRPIPTAPTTTGAATASTAITAAAACRGIASPSTVRWPGCSTAGSATSSSGRRAPDTRSTTAPIPTWSCIPSCWTTTGWCSAWGTTNTGRLPCATTSKPGSPPGGNAAFFSGNSVCWRVRSEEEGRALVCWKQQFNMDPAYFAGDFADLSTLWSHHLVGRPENELTGVGFLYGGYHLSHGQYMDGSGAFTVHRPEHWVFAGTILQRGDSFGGEHTIVGYECDGCEFALEDGLPVPKGTYGTPQGLHHPVHRPCPVAPERQRVVRALGEGQGGRRGHGPLHPRRHGVHRRDHRLVARAQRRRGRCPDHRQRPRPAEPVAAGEQGAANLQPDPGRGGGTSRHAKAPLRNCSHSGACHSTTYLVGVRADSP